MDTITKLKTAPFILLVEDEPIVQKVHHTLLEKIGCRVELATTGAEALAMFSNGHHLIFMDIGLPDISGVTITAEIRRRENNMAHIPIIALTAYSQPDIQQQCLNAGADAVFTKPINLEKLKEILRQYTKFEF